MRAWVLVEDQMDYDQSDRVVGVYATLDEAKAAVPVLIERDISEAMYPDTQRPYSEAQWYTLTLWDGSQEIEQWEKRGLGAEWTARAITIQGEATR